MNFGWLKTVGRVALAVGASGVIPGASPIVIAAANVVEAISAGKGKTKEDQAMALIPAVASSLNMAGLPLGVPAVAEASRKVMQAYVASQNALTAFEEAKAALEAVVANYHTTSTLPK